MDVASSHSSADKRDTRRICEDADRKHAAEQIITCDILVAEINDAIRTRSRIVRTLTEKLLEQIEITTERQRQDVVREWVEGWLGDMFSAASFEANVTKERMLRGVLADLRASER